MKRKVDPDGLVWLQQTGNAFIARNFITNNQLEAIQLNAGPGSIVGNTFYTRVNVPDCCALAGEINASRLSGTGNQNNSFTFVGNWVYGDQIGHRALNNLFPTVVNFSGNWLNLSPIIPGFASESGPGEAINLQFCSAANIFGNQMVSGGRGLAFTTNCANVMVMHNDFGGATYGAIGYVTGGDSVANAQIYSNILGEGVNFHVQLPYTNSFGWFMSSNLYWDINSNSVPVFLDPTSSAIHLVN